MIRLDNGVLRAGIGARGAELLSLCGGDGTEYIWQRDSRYWDRSAPILFPYVGRLGSGRCTFDGREYRLPLHGFAPESEFAVVERTDASVILALADSAQTRACFPFRFLLRVRYALEERTLSVVVEVENRGEGPMYFGLGGHPGIRVPLAPGLRFEDYRVVFKSPCAPQRIVLGEDRLISGRAEPFPLVDGRVLPLQRSLFNVDAVVLTGMADALTIGTPGDSHAVTVAYPGVPYVGLWQTARSDAAFLCVEPWYSLPARSGVIEDLATQPSLLSLASGKAGTYGWSLTVAP